MLSLVYIYFIISLHPSVPNCQVTNVGKMRHISSCEESQCVTVEALILIKPSSTKVKEEDGKECPCDKDPVWIQDILHPF